MTRTWTTDEENASVELGVDFTVVRELAQATRHDWLDALHALAPYDEESYYWTFIHTEPATCSICDGIHGSICPIEEDPNYDPRGDVGPYYLY